MERKMSSISCVNVSAQFVQCRTDGALQIRRSRLQPVVRNQRDHTGLAAQPGVTKRFEGCFVGGARGFGIESRTNFGEEGLQAFSGADAEGSESLRELRIRCRHWLR